MNQHFLADDSLRRRSFHKRAVIHHGTSFSWRPAPSLPPFHPLKHLRYTRDLGSSAGHSLAHLRMKRICPPPPTRRGPLSVRLRAATRYTVRIGPLAWSVLRLREYLWQFDIHVGYFNIKCRHHVLHQSLYCRTIQVFYSIRSIIFWHLKFLIMHRWLTGDERKWWQKAKQGW